MVLLPSPKPMEVSMSEEPDQPGEGAPVPESQAPELLPEREPFWGGALSFLGLMLVIGGPVWILLTAMFQAREVGRVLDNIRKSGAVRPGELPETWSIALDPILVVYSGALALVLTLVLLALIAVTLFTIRGVALRLNARIDEQASSRYAEELRGEAVLTEESWTRDLPEPDPPSYRDRSAPPEG